MRTAKRILAEFMTVVMVLQACSPTVAAVAAGWQNISSEIATASAEASDTAESGETKSDAAIGSGSSDAGADSDGAGDDAAKDDAASGDTADGATGSDSTDDQTEGDDAAGDAAADDTEQDADAAASEDTEAQAGATITNLDDLVTLLEANGAENIVRKDDGSGIQSLDVTVSTAFTVLSNADASLYYDAQININMSGDAKLTEAVDNLSFQGFGSDTHPFEGKIYSSSSPNDPVELTADRTVFNNLKLTDQNNTIKIKWVGATTYSAPMVASKIIGEGRELNAAVNIANPSGTNETIPTATPALTAPLLGETTGSLTANVTYSLTGDRKGLNVDATGNIGLLANTVKDGAFTVKSVKFPADLVGDGTVKTSSDNAGLLVGEVEDNATLSVGILTNIPTATVQSTNGSAGGVVGLVGSNTGATVNVTKALDLHTLTVKGTTASGGLIGKATHLSLSQSEGAKATCPEHVGDSKSAISGGFIGMVSFAQSIEFTGNNQIDTGNDVTLAGALHVKDGVDGAGSVFGVLALDDPSVSVSFKGGSFKSTFGDDASNAAFGGLIGFVSGAADSTAETSPLSLLKVEDVTAEFSLVKSPYFAGGIVGWLGTSVAPAALEINNATVKCTQVASTSNGFGGAVGCIDKNSVADVSGITVSNEGSIAKGAGIAAECWAATIRLGGVADFTNMHFNAGDATAQIAMVRSDYPSLVFARGTGSDNEPTDSDNKDYWIYKRCSATKIDDLGGAQDVACGYGEVIRLDGDKLPKSLIQINASTHKLKDPSTSDWSWQLGYGNSWSSGNRELTINSEKDLACLALSVQFANLWNGVYGLNPDQKAQLLGSDVTINLNHDVDLSGTGIGGLGLDSASNGVSFSGTFNGNNHKVTLAIGEPYGTRDGKTLAAGDASEGNGKIYRHGRLGLFNAVNGASISSVTIAGSMKFENQSNIDAGALAGTKIGGDTLLSSVTFSAGIEYESTNKDNYLHVGGIIGSMSGAGSLKIGSRESPSSINAKIDSNTQESGATCVGAAIGYVADDCIPSAAGKTVEVDGLAVSGSISIENGSAETYAGGFIGQIAQGGVDEKTGALTSVKQIEITKLDFIDFSLETAGSKTTSSGGFLGYSWAGTEVTLGDSVNANEKRYAITASGSSVKSTYAKELGGLVYAASGHWIINDYAINLSGASFIADNATALSVLIARGSTSVSGNSFGAEVSYSGLYLEDRAWWGTAYAVDGVSIAAPKVTTFDEWVANGVKPGSKLMDNGCNAIVSLHTKVNKLDMSGDPDKDNSYQNRTAFGAGHETNGSVRYYYNLDRALTRAQDLKSSVMETPEHLVLWAARKYAPSATYDFLTDNLKLIFTNNVIGPKSGNPVTIDLTGYSYYPSNVSDGNVTIQNAEIIFCYSKIKDEQQNNKSNDSDTQHENMHCGLIRTIGNRDLTVSGVTLSGTVGRAKNDDAKGLDPKSVSGALVLRCAYGASGDKKSTIKIDTLVLDGLQVDRAEDGKYAPLLINAITRYVNFDVKNVTTADYAGASGTNKIAASSLFGYLGYDKNSDQVTAKFEQISLPSQKGNTIFAHASLLESFGYTTTGTADYTFTRADAVAGNVTYGSEIDAKGKEYTGKQLWYYDEATYGTDQGLVETDKGEKANVEAQRFSNYLPYVAKGKATENGVQYHEIKVNQRIPNFTTGCGTYGDPYAITSASELNAAANYINNGTALDGWEVTIAKDQSTLCQRRNGGSTENEVTYVYKETNDATKKWEKKTGNSTDSNDVLSDDTMRRYLQSAYYSIEPKSDANNTIELDGSAFAGFGTASYPFRGVIVGDLGSATATIVIKNNTGSLRGLIPYSYGSVVRNLNIRYVDAQATITYSSKNADGVPTAFFGGVIGCILGGDNIIDGVVVNGTTADSPVTGFTVAGGGTKSHLVPIGGYVGAIAGGGVIFRNMSGTSWHAGTREKFKKASEGGANYQLYDNPYVGRVIDGYAFSEDCTVDNGDANYKINELTDKGTACVTTIGTDNKYIGADAEAPVTTVENAQGLLVLSAIISSGAGAGAAHTSYADYGVFRGSKAYWGNDTEDPAICGYLFGNKNYGKVRNASYDSVGRPATADNDFATAKNDDQKAPGKQGWHGPLDADNDVNSPYLVASYAADYQTGYVCASKSIGMSLEFKQGDTYNMTGYGTGYVGLNGRYYSNACDSNEATTDRDRITPHVATIDGNGATITVGTKDTAYGAVEYADDDYKVSGVGGLFSTVMFTSTNVGQSVTANDGAQVKDLTFSNCNIALTYIDANGKAATAEASNDLIGAGLLAGATANYDSNTCGVYRNVQMGNCTVLGAKSVGGLLGSSGRAGRNKSKDRTYMVEFSDTRAPVYLHDCSYTGLNVAGEKYVGGYVGTVASSSGVWTTATEGVGEKAVGKNSTITATGTTPYVGGVLGFAKSSNISVNTNIGTTTAVQSSTAVISGVNVLATGSNTDKYMGAGGVVGRADGGVISMSNVRIGAEGGIESVTIGDKAGTNKSIRNAGGLIGEVTSSGNPNKYWFEGCSVKNVNVAGTDQCSGGLIGYYYSNVNITCNNIAIEGASIKGSWSGGLLGAINSGSDVINVTNTKVSNTTFSGTSNGGIAGDGRGQFHLVNVLMDSNIYKAGVKQGVLLGEADTSDGNRYSLSAAGVDVKPGNGKTTSDLPPMVYTANTAAVNKKTYIAFGDYEDTLSDAKGATLYGNDDATGNVTAAVSPYVATSPTSGLAVRASASDATDRYLFGDGINVGLAADIQSQAVANVSGRYIYTNIGGIDDKGAYQKTSSYDATSVASTFNENNEKDNQVTTDFPVLVISGTDNTTVTSYLNIITNGGFSDACRLNNENGTNPHVTAKAEVFRLNNGVFVKDDGASGNPTLRVVNNGKKNMSFSPSSDWDNGKGRFTLLTVTFTEAGQSYNVQVPIIVKRKLEIDFTATYDYGTNFKESNYARLGKDAHVLTSFGEPMTGLLTWTYNSANGAEVDFGWDSYMAAGGSMKGLGKSILFDGADGRLPQGTQLTLVDANVDGKAGGREYHYTVGEGGATSVSLSGEDVFKDSAGKPYQERWLGEILGVSAKQDNDGTWAVCDNEAEATAKAKLGDTWTLFKVAGADVSADKRYKLTVPKDEDSGKEKRASESVYLVVNVPKSTGVSKINGFTNTPGSFDSSSSRVAVNMHRVLRPNNASGGKDPDIQNNTASTYSILSNYGQAVADNEGEARTLVSQSKDGAAYVLSLDVTDKITFNTDQIYATNDSLFYQLDTSLCQYDANDTLNGVSSFPSGTSAIAEFYVAIGSQNYTWDSADKKWVPRDASTPAFTQTVTDTGNDSLKLTLEHNLAGIRALANGSFTVRTVVKEIRLTPDGCNDVIALSQQSGEDACTKMSYIAKLSTRKSGLDTSSLAVTTRGHVGYYRMNKGGATITLSAPDKSQLGINVDDLRPIADGTIGLGATYEVGGLNNATEAIANAGSVVYTLKLQRRSGTDGSYEDVTGNISDYVTVTESKLATVNAADNAITFTDSKEDGKFRTQNGDTTFNLPFTVKVNTQVEQRDQFYANYRLVMTASLITSDVASTTPQSPDYVTYTLTRVNLNGIDHGSESN